MWCPFGGVSPEDNSLEIVSMTNLFYRHASAIVYSVPLQSYMLVKDVARELGVTDQHVRQLIRRARLIGEQLSPRLYLVERASVEAYKRERRPAGRPPASSRAER
jgi:excisionase family DNA binding protein